MGYYDDERNQNFKINLAGNRDIAGGYIGKARNVIERIQGDLDLGANLGVMKKQRYVLSPDTLLDINVLPGGTNPLVYATITSGVPEALAPIAEIKALVANSCPPLPVGRPEARLYTQLFPEGDFEEITDYVKTIVTNTVAPIPDFLTQPVVMKSALIDLSAVPSDIWAEPRVWWDDKEYERFWLDDHGNVYFDGGFIDDFNRWGVNGGLCGSGFGIQPSDATSVPWGADYNNYIAMFAGEKGVNSLSFSSSDPIRIFRGDSIQVSGETDSNGFDVLVSRRCTVIQRRGTSFSLLIDGSAERGTFTVQKKEPDAEMVWMEGDPIYACSDALGIFYNGDDGTPLVFDEQGDWGQREGLKGWCNTFFQAETADTYDICWFLSRGIPNFCPGLLNNIGEFPRLHSIFFCRSNNRPWGYASPYVSEGTGLGYANDMYLGRTWWFLKDGRGNVTGLQLQDRRNGDTADPEGEFTFR